MLKHRLVPRGLRLMAAFVLLAGMVGVWWLPPVRAQRLLRQAREALTQRRTEDALALLQRMQQTDPDSSEAEFLLARAARRQGRFQDVQTHLSRAARLEYDRELLQREQWLAMAQAGQVREAAAHLSQLLRDPRGDGQAICEAFVEGFFATYRFDQALPVLDAWQADYPDDAQPHLYWALFHEHFSNWPEAAESYRRALARAPQQTEPHLRLAKLLVRMHQYDEAAGHFEHCLRDAPENPEVGSGWARCLQARGRTHEARDVLQHVLQSHPEHDDARLAIAQLEHAEGHEPQALEWLRVYCQNRPTDTEARYLLAQVLQAVGRGEEAKAHFEFVAEARQQMAQVQQLIDDVRTDPNNADLRYRIGIRLLKYDVPEHGAEWLRSVLDIRPQHGPAHAALADYYSSIANDELAEWHRRRAAAGASFDASATNPVWALPESGQPGKTQQ